MSLKIANEDCASILRVLADVTRLRVMQLLLKHPMIVGELQDALETDQSLLSHHLKVLRDAGLVVAYREGKSVRYELSALLQSQQIGHGFDLGCCRISFEPS